MWHVHFLPVVSTQPTRLRQQMMKSYKWLIHHCRYKCEKYAQAQGNKVSADTWHLKKGLLFLNTKDIWNYTGPGTKPWKWRRFICLPKVPRKAPRYHLKKAGITWGRQNDAAYTDGETYDVFHIKDEYVWCLGVAECRVKFLLPQPQCQRSSFLLVVQAGT